MKKLLEELNNVQIDLSEYEIEELSELERKKMSKKVRESLEYNNKEKKKISKITAALAGVLLVPVLTTGVYAGVKLVSQSIESISGIEEGTLNTYKDIVGKEISKDGYTVQLNEVMFDVDSIAVSSTIKKENGKLSEDFMDVRVSDIYIDGKSISNSGGIQHERVSDNTEIQLSKLFYDEGIHLTGDSKVKVVYTLAKEGIVTDMPKWEFEFNANLDKMKSEIKRAEIDKEIEYKGTKIVDLSDIVVSPASTIINGSLIDESNYEVYFKIQDEYGNYLKEDIKLVENKSKIACRFYSSGDKVSKLKIIPIIKDLSTEEKIELEDKSFEVNI